jgi:hypothetical protein
LNKNIQTGKSGFYLTIWLKIATFMMKSEILVMKSVRLTLVVIGFLIISSCGKIIEDKQRNLLVAIMTSGQWHVESYKEGTLEVTDQFQGYNFQFKEDGSVTGDNGTNIISGSWLEDVQNYSISSNFPSAADPVKKLNGTWKIKDSSLDYVAAEMKTTQGIMILHLRKNV